MALLKTQCQLVSEGIIPSSPAPCGAAALFRRSWHRCGVTGNRGLGHRAWHPTAEPH